MVNTPDRAAADPVGNNLDSVTPIPPPLEAVPRLSDVLRAGVVTGITSGLVCWLLYGIGTLFGTDFAVSTGIGGLVHLPWYEVLLSPVAGAVLFALVAAALRRRRNCRRHTLLLGYGIAVLAVIPVLLQPDDVTWPTRIWLIAFTVVSAVIVVPQVARVVGDSDPWVTVGHRRIGLDAD